MCTYWCFMSYMSGGSRIFEMGGSLLPGSSHIAVPINRDRYEGSLRIKYWVSNLNSK